MASKHRRRTPPRPATARRAAAAPPTWPLPMQRIPLSEARSHLSALVQQAATQRHVTAITVHDELKAFLIAPSRLEALLEAERKARTSRKRKSKLRGSLRIMGDLEAADESPSQRLQRSALASAEVLELE
ncbi:type II toxin-antitoxin system Phd/YefM family antitoxin [Corallococcus interemptor]|uniref:Antitoxin n=2 Tax=Corallococcus interemptor TaxID=2316720 RepID=A0A3A8PME6_9BACT|nr:type II toxin-antitoxin system Phd/YefM family antitoxin [Corallococcus interemptor]